MRTVLSPEIGKAFIMGSDSQSRLRTLSISAITSNPDLYNEDVIALGGSSSTILCLNSRLVIHVKNVW